MITGGSKGIGKVTAKHFADNGYDVVVNYNTDIKGANEVVKNIQKVGRKALALQADVSDSKQVKELIKKTLNEFGQINVLVNNAGIQTIYDIEDLSEEAWSFVDMPTTATYS